MLNQPSCVGLHHVELLCILLSCPLQVWVLEQGRLSQKLRPSEAGLV